MPVEGVALLLTLQLLVFLCSVCNVVSTCAEMPTPHLRSKTRRFTKLRLRQFTKSGEYHYVVKVSGNEGMTAQWQHMQRQFHISPPPRLKLC